MSRYWELFLSISSHSFDKLSEHLFTVYSDNKATVTWVNKGPIACSAKQRDALIFIYLRFLFVQVLNAYNIKGRVNVLADALARSVDFNPELELKPNTFSKLFQTANFLPDIVLIVDNPYH